MLYRGIEDQSVGISVALAGFAIADVNTIYSTHCRPMNFTKKIADVNTNAMQ